MDALIEVNRTVHIVAGFAGITSWWIPVFAAKGGPIHRRAGWVFVLAAYVAGSSAVASPILRISDARLAGMPWDAVARDGGFLLLLGYLGVVTLGVTHFGVRVLRTRREPGRLASPVIRLLIVGMVAASLAIALYAVTTWTPLSILLLGLSPVGLLNGLEQHRYIRRPPPLRKPWFYAHMNAMLGAGIAFHTAFLIFGSRVLFDYSVFGAFNWVPWVIPAVVGLVGGRAWQRMYMRKFGDLPARRDA
jgi:hypothetical protein